MKKAFRKALSILLVAVMLVSSAPLAGFLSLELPDWFDFSKLFAVEAEAATYSGTCGENLTWTLKTSTGELTISGTGAMTDWPSSRTAPWLSYLSYIKTVKIGNGVKSIGDWAFCDCTSLTSVTIPDSVTSIGGAAFSCCISLTSITIPDSVTSIGVLAFDECTSLTSITIPDSVTSIDEGAFCECTSLTSVTFPNGVTSIVGYTFIGCSSLTNITIPDGVTNIGKYAFGDCSSLTSITIPDSVKTIGDKAFLECEGLTDVYYPGTEAEWNAISIGSYNYELIDATIHFEYNDCSSLDWTLECDREINNGYLTIDAGKRLLFECSVKYNLCDDAYVEQSFEGGPYWAYYTICDDDDETIYLSGSITINGMNGDPIVSGTKYEYILDIPTDKLLAGKYRIIFHVPDIYCDYHVEHFTYQKEMRFEILDVACCNLDDTIIETEYEFYNGCLMVPEGGYTTSDFKVFFDICPYGFVESDSNGAVYLSYSINKLNSDIDRVLGFGIINSNNLEAVESGKEYNMSFNLGTENLEPGEYELRFKYPKIGCDLHENYIYVDTSYVIRIVENGTLVFDANGGSGAPQAMTDAVYYTIPSTVPIREGYVFEGWSPSGNSGEIFKSGDKYGIFRGSTLYAVWKLDSEFVPQPTVSKISYGDSIVLHADVAEVPEGGYILWTASNGNFDYTVSADGTTCTITPSKSGDTVFTATVYDAEGNEVCKDEQTMTSKAGFFDKIIAFFKKLFGLTKVIPQAFNSIY